MSHFVSRIVASLFIATCLCSCAPITRLAKSALSMPMRVLQSVKGGSASVDSAPSSSAAIAARGAEVQARGEFGGPNVATKAALTTWWKF